MPGTTVSVAPFSRRSANSGAVLRRPQGAGSTSTVHRRGYLFCVPWFFEKENHAGSGGSVVGSVTIIEIVYFNVQVDAWLNDWYGGFYDIDPDGAADSPIRSPSINMSARSSTVIGGARPTSWCWCSSPSSTSHYLFRWRRAMTFYYMANWHIAPQDRGRGAARPGRHPEFRVDRRETWAQLRLLADDADRVPANPLGPVGRISPSCRGSGMSRAALSGWRCSRRCSARCFLRSPVSGCRASTSHNQRVEAAFRKELVYGEDDAARAQPPTFRELFANVQRNYFRLYFHYTYFNLFAVRVPAGRRPSCRFSRSGRRSSRARSRSGIFQQICNAFGQVSDSFQFFAEFLDDDRRSDLDLPASASLRELHPHGPGTDQDQRLWRGNDLAPLVDGLNRLQAKGRPRAA